MRRTVMGESRRNAAAAVFSAAEIRHGDASGVSGPRSSANRSSLGILAWLFPKYGHYADSARMTTKAVLPPSLLRRFVADE